MKIIQGFSYRIEDTPRTNFGPDLLCILCRTIAQAVRRRLPTAAAWVRARVWSCGICGGQSGAGAGFLRVLRSPLPIFIPPIAPQSPSSIIWGLYNRPEVAAVPSALSPTPLIIIKNNTLHLSKTWRATNCKGMQYVHLVPVLMSVAMRPLSVCHLTFNNVACRPVARQRLCKQRPLLGNRFLPCTLEQKHRNGVLCAAR
jgi:hypothetical protein